MWLRRVNLGLETVARNSFHAVAATFVGSKGEPALRGQSGVWPLTLAADSVRAHTDGARQGKGGRIRRLTSGATSQVPDEAYPPFGQTREANGRSSSASPCCDGLSP